MKILLVIDRIVTGGAERILVDYYHYLERNGHEPYVFALSGNLSQSKWSEGLRVTYGSIGDEDNVIKKGFQQLSLLLKLRKQVKRIRPDGIFSFLEKSNLLTVLVSAGKTVKVVSVHNVLSIQYTKIRNNFIRGMVYRIIRWAYNRCPKVIAVSKQVKDDLVANFGVKKEHIHVINNFVDRQDILSKTLEAIDNFEFKKDVKYVMNVGRFSDQKAQWKLIKAFSLCVQKISCNVELVLMGAGEYTDRLKQLSMDLGISNKIHILPFNVNPYKYMAKAHLFVLSSIYEGFPIVLAEISSLRIPFVGSKKAVPEEMFDDVNVWNESIFKNIMLEKDFTTKTHGDEIDLSNLIQRGVEDDSFRKKLLDHTKKWEEENYKEKQFYFYDQLLEVVK